MVNTSSVSSREAVYDINRYLSYRFYDLNPKLLNQTMGTRIPSSPFWPIQSDPSTRVPYIRYIVRETADVSNWWLRLGTVSYAVYAHDVGRSAHIVNIMVDLLARGSDSASELMRWRQTAVTSSGTVYPQDYLFHSIEFLGGHNTEPTDEEAGAHVRFATFRYQYSPVGGTNIA